jgi:hypothetical protein
MQATLYRHHLFFTDEVRMGVVQRYICPAGILLGSVLYLVRAAALPDSRKSDWYRAGCFRQMDSVLVVSRVNSVADYTDGETSDYSGAVARAIEDRTGDELTMVMFPEGTYRFTNPVTLDQTNNIILCGAGSDKTRCIFNFDGRDRKQCIEIRSARTVGIEDMYIEREDSSDHGENIRIRSDHCWVHGVESNKAVSIHISIASSRNVEVRGCHIHHGWNYGTGGHGYGVELGADAVHCLVENNIFNHLRHSIILSNGPHSNVAGYNYSTDPFTTEEYFGLTDWPCDLCLHGHPDRPSGPHRNLFEGNICAFMHADDAWEDNGPYNTFFRNRATYYGLRIFSLSDSQNVVANEVDDSDGRLADFAWDAFTIQSSGNFIQGNTNLDPEPPVYPDSQGYVSERSLYLDTAHLPPFLGVLDYFPPIGAVDKRNRGGGTIPAKMRWDSGEALTVSEKPYGVENGVWKMPPGGGIRSSPPLTVWINSEHTLAVRLCLQHGTPFSVSIYDIQGRRKRVLIDNRTAGTGLDLFRWDLRSIFTQRITPGIYFVQMSLPGKTYVSPISIVQ